MYPGCPGAQFYPERGYESVRQSGFKQPDDDVVYLNAADPRRRHGERHRNSRSDKAM